MTDSEKLDLILQKVSGLDDKVNNLDQKVTALELHLENGTDKAVKLIAENFTVLTDKLNQAIPVANKNLAYEVKVNYLIEEVDKLKKELTELKNKIA